MSIETKISPLIENMFPSFYREEGPNFVAFVKAYYEWLEENSQLLTLEDNTNFNVGDILTQGSVTGTLISILDSNLLVVVDGLETFKCITVCSDLTPITSSSGGSSRIKQGGLSRRLGSLYLSRNLLNLRDIDTTMDIFLTKFKEKYLCNIEFDTDTNKKLLVKNSFDLYRSKGTSRSIDLFFRLMYGVNSEVYYPGDDLFKLSEGEWFKPQYLEISCVADSSSRAIQLIGKFITGVSSGAQAFVEKYIKHKTESGFTHVLYVTNVSGTFKRGELIKSDQVYSDSPSIIGSMGALSSIDGISGGFSIGDIVTVHSVSGINGLAKVTSVNDSTGSIKFDLLNSGWGYSVNTGNTDPAFIQSDSSQTIVSNNVLFLSNLNTGNVVSSVTVSTAGLGYSNTDVITIRSEYSNGVARPVTNSTGGVTSIVLIYPGAGFFSTTPSISVSNSIGGSTAGSGLSASFSFEVPKKNFTYLEPVVQKKANIIYDSANDSSKLSSNVDIIVKNGANILGSGVIVSVKPNTSSNGTMTVLLTNNFMVSTNNKIVLSSNTLISANIASFTDVSATGLLMSIPSSGTLYPQNGSTFFSVFKDDIIYQKDAGNEVTASATVLEDVILNGPIPVGSVSGSFVIGSNLYSLNSLLNISLSDYQTDFGVFQVNNSFTSASTVSNAKIMLPFTGVTGILDSFSTGSSARYGVSNVLNSETVSLNTNILSNTINLSTRLNSTSFGFPRLPSANLSSKISNTLTYKNFVLGEIYNMGFIDPGFGYNHEPYLLPYQPYTSGYDNKDYIFTVSNVNGSFLPGEYVQQNYGVTVAKGIIKSISNNKMFIKRIQFDNKFNPSLSIVGITTGATANILISEDSSVSPIGWNANVHATVFTSNGIVTGLSVTDSGFGFINGQEAVFSLDGKTGTAKVLNIGLGTGSGRYKNSKGFLSDLSKLHDGTYYQEYSYDIISRIPLDKYSGMFKKVMHTAGTKFFGSVLIDSINELTVTASNTAMSNDNPYIVQDRILVNILDRSEVTIEVRS